MFGELKFQFSDLSKKMAVFKHFIVLEGDIAEGISKNLIWAGVSYGPKVNASELHF